MPYVRPVYRRYVKEQLDALVDVLQTVDDDQLDGVMNYVTFVLFKRVYNPVKYARLNRAMGVLTCMPAEFYRRVVAPYEDIKIEENGDIC